MSNPIYRQWPRVISPVVVTCDESTFQQRRASAPLHIMVVDDDPITHRMMKKIFGDRYRLTFCTGASQAVHEYLTELPDLTFLDIDLGEVEFNGIDVLHTMHMYDKDACVVIVSGQDSRENIAHAARAGANGFIVKPFIPSFLLKHAHECERIKGH